MPSWCAISMISSQRSAPAFFCATMVAHALDEDLAAAARDRVEARLLQLANDVARVHAEQLREEVDFARAEAVDVDRVVALDVPQQVEVPLERDVRIVPALHEDLHAAERLGLVDLRADLLERERPALAVLGAAVERAEAAVGDADVRVVDVAVDDVRDDVAADASPGARDRPRRRARGAARWCRSREDPHGMARRPDVTASASGRGKEGEVPLGTRPRATSRRKNSVSPARCWYDSP